MVAEPIKVRPPALVQAAASAAMTAEKAAAPHPGAVPVASAGSPADGAAATIAAGMSVKSTQLTTKLAGKGPQVQAKTQSGVAQLQGQDEQNAAKIQQLGNGMQGPALARDAAFGRDLPLDGGGAPQPPAPAPPPRGLPPDGVQPPVSGNLTPGPASRPSEASRGGQSLWDNKGGEWRYFPGDQWHNPHWDYNPHNVPNAEWQNVPINNLPPVKSGPPAEAPAAPPAPAPRPAPAPPPAPKPAPPIEAGEGPMIGGGPAFGPHVVPPPHSIHHMPIVGEDDLDAPWEYEP